MDDLISRQAAIDADEDFYSRAEKRDCEYWDSESSFCALNRPSAQPSYTKEEIQKIQELEQAEIEKAFELGRKDALSEIISSYAERKGDPSHPFADDVMMGECGADMRGEQND